MPHMISDVVCPFCGSLCDDLRLVLEKGRVKEIYNACALSQSRFAEVGRVANRNLYPLRREGASHRRIGYDEALDEAVEILRSSDHPLLYGWATTSCEAQKAGVELAEALGASIDDTSSVCHGPTTLGVQDVGHVTATLGVVRNRADTIIYWGCNPFHSHPRHISRYTVFPKGYFRGGRGERTVIVVDPRESDTSSIADLRLRPKVGSDYEVLNALRVLIRGGSLHLSEAGGIRREELESLAEIMVSSEFGALFFGLGLTMSRGRHRNVEAALQLVRDLNDKTKWVLGAMRGHYNVAGFNEVCAWETGFPFAVDLTRGYPRYNPGETSAVDLLRNGEIDATLVVASDPIAHLPRRISRSLRSMPLIAVDPFRSLTTSAADLVIPSLVSGIETSGTAYRMDGVPITMRKVCDGPPGLMSDEEIIRSMLRRLEEREA